MGSRTTASAPPPGGTRRCGTPGAQGGRDKQRTRLKSESGKQLIVPLEPEHWLLDIDKIPDYRIPRPAHLPKTEGSRRYKRQLNKNKQLSGQAIEDPDAEDKELQGAMLESYRDSRDSERKFRRGPSEETE